MVDVLRFLYLAAVLALAVLIAPRSAHYYPVSIGRHPDALRITPCDVKAQLVAPAGVRVVHEQRSHLLGVKDVGATTTTSHQRIIEHLITAPHFVDWIQLQKLLSDNDNIQVLLV